MRLAGVVCVKNQSIHRLSLHLASIAWQIVPGDIAPRFSYTVVDYGSTPEYRALLRPLVDHFGFNLIEVNRDTEPWRHGRAFNIGIKANSQADYIFTTGGDLVFEPDLLSKAIALAGPKVYVNAPLARTKAGGTLEVSEGAYYGTLALIEKSWWFHRRGYEEDYTYWGREDHDLYERAKWDDFVVKTADSRAWHQYHESQVVASASIRNTEIYYARQGQKDRNNTCWGEMDRYCGDVR